MAIGKLTILLTVCWLATLLVATTGESLRRSERSDRRVAAVRESKSQLQRDVDAERRQERLGQLPQRVLQTRDERSLTRSSGSGRLDGRRAQESRINAVADRHAASQTAGDRRRSLSSEDVALTGRRDSQRRRELDTERRQESTLVRRTRSISPSTVSEERDVQRRRRASNRLSRSRSEDGLLLARRHQSERSERRFTRQDSSKTQLEDARRQSPERRREAVSRDTRERREKTDTRRSESESHREVENRIQNQDRRDNRRENSERRREVNGQERRQRVVADDKRRAVVSTVAVGTDDRRETAVKRDVRNIVNVRKQDLDLAGSHKFISSHDQLNIFDKDYTQYAKWESCSQGLLTGLVGVALFAMKSSSKSAY